jgi:hypothetical protein
VLAYKTSSCGPSVRAAASRFTDMAVARARSAGLTSAATFVAFFIKPGTDCVVGCKNEQNCTAQAPGRGHPNSLLNAGGNVTGLSILDVELGPKRLELLHELERRGYDVRGKTPAQIRQMLRRRPTKPKSDATPSARR